MVGHECGCRRCTAELPTMDHGFAVYLKHMPDALMPWRMRNADMPESRCMIPEVGPYGLPWGRSHGLDRKWLVAVVFVWAAGITLAPHWAVLRSRCQPAAEWDGRGAELCVCKRGVREACLSTAPQLWTTQVHPLDEQPGHPTVLVVPIPESDSRGYLKVCPSWKSQQKILWAVSE